ncbi:hypothetical protein DIPPA_13714 [Diplonema papillatum]|nr:hypothetical protein DIPPA_13714 [Diplonema papillatum]
MSKFRDRFKDKISVVARDGVHVNVSTGVVERPAVRVSAQSRDPAGGPQHSAPPPSDSGGGGTHDRPTPPAVAHGRQPLTAPRKTSREPHQPSASLTGYTAAPLGSADGDGSGSPLLSDAEWLQKAAEVTQQQLHLLQRQLGVAQQHPQHNRDGFSRESSAGTADAPPPQARPLPHRKQHPHPSRPKQTQHAPTTTTTLPQLSSQAVVQQAGGSGDGVSAVKYGRRAPGPGSPPPPVAGHKQYKPYTLAEFKALNQPVKLGGLGPEDSDEKQQLRHQKEVARRYAASVKAANSASSAASVAARGHVPLLKQPTPQQKLAAERRAKALEFAANVPKPKVACSPGAAGASAQSDEGDCLPTAAELQLQTLEAQHEKDMAAIVEIKRNLGM